MPEKGFDLKVLLPTDDGLTISRNGIQEALYYLLYNVSNRSYQFAGKVKTSEWYPDKRFSVTDFSRLLKEEKIDLVLTLSSIIPDIPCEYLIVDEKEISTNLNQLIDETDKKKS
ncbi:MAG TPA: hypothetical protein VJ896_05130 [Bacteroidales bacterium]|nr:hypothetical protein [Bacteroidales bacterium]